MNYPHPCVRCGLCCFSTPCPNAILYGDVEVEHGKACPHLSFDAGTQEAVCGMIVAKPDMLELFGIGKGCCISARVVVNGEAFDYASLSKEHKFAVMKRMKGA